MLLKKLVIADDDDAVAHLVAFSLGDAGFLCLRACNGQQALDIVRTEIPDAVVLDVMMPEMDGIEVCRQLKGDVMLSRIPILLLTSMVDVDDRVAGLEAGADDYLGKPFDMRELAARVKALIRQSRRERDRSSTTNLPGSQAIEDHVDELLAAKTPFSLMYVDLENFRAYADVYGYMKANEVVAHTGQPILQVCREAASPPPFVGHVGGDDFIVIGSHDVAGPVRDEIVSLFSESVEDHYDDEAREKKHIMFMMPDGREREVQFMVPSVATIEVGAGQYRHNEELSKEVARVKSETRRRTGSGLIPIGHRPPSQAD